MTDPVLGEIRDLLTEIRDAVKPPERPRPAPRTSRPGRVFTNGQVIPSDVDLVVVGNGQRWVRIAVDGQPTELWCPRDVTGPELSSNDLLSSAGHVTEVPASVEEGA